MVTHLGPTRHHQGHTHHPDMATLHIKGVILQLVIPLLVVTLLLVMLMVAILLLVIHHMVILVHLLHMPQV